MAGAPGNFKGRMFWAISSLLSLLVALPVQSGDIQPPKPFYSFTEKLPLATLRSEQLDLFSLGYRAPNKYVGESSANPFVKFKLLPAKKITQRGLIRVISVSVSGNRESLRDIQGYQISLKEAGTEKSIGESPFQVAFKLPRKDDYVLCRWTTSLDTADKSSYRLLADGYLTELTTITASAIPDSLWVTISPNTLKAVRPSDRIFWLNTKQIEQIGNKGADPKKGQLLLKDGSGAFGRFSIPLSSLDLDGKLALYKGNTSSPIGGESPVAKLLSIDGNKCEVGYYSMKRKAICVARIEGLDVKQIIEMPICHGNLGTIIRDPEGNYFYFTYEDATNPKAEIVKVNSEGKLLAHTMLDCQMGARNIYSLKGTISNLSVFRGVVCLLTERFMQSGADGLHHQGTLLLSFKADTLSMIKDQGQNSSHSFDNRITHDNQTFLSIDLGDNYPRGIIIHRIWSNEKAGRVVLTYKTYHDPVPSPYAKDKNGFPLPAGKWSNDNRTYSELGGVVPTNGGYLVAFATERSTDNALASQALNDPRNLGVVLVSPSFERAPKTGNVVNSDVVISEGEGSPEFGFYTFAGGYERQKNHGIVWLTKYTDKSKETATKPRLVNIGTGRALLMWEKWTQKKFVSSQAMFLSARGNPISSIIDLGPDCHMSLGEEPVWLDGRVLWLRVTNNTLDINVWDTKDKATTE